MYYSAPEPEVEKIRHVVEARDPEESLTWILTPETSANQTSEFSQERARKPKVLPEKRERRGKRGSNKKREEPPLKKTMKKRRKRESVDVVVPIRQSVPSPPSSFPRPIKISIATGVLVIIAVLVATTLTMRLRNKSTSKSRNKTTTAASTRQTEKKPGTSTRTRTAILRVPRSARPAYDGNTVTPTSLKPQSSSPSMGMEVADFREQSSL